MKTFFSLRHILNVVKLMTVHSVETMSVDTSLLFHSIIAVLSQVIEKWSSSSCTDCILVARGPYQHVWDCAVTVYCSSLISK